MQSTARRRLCEGCYSVEVSVLRFKGLVRRRGGLSMMQEALALLRFATLCERLSVLLFVALWLNDGSMGLVGGSRKARGLAFTSEFAR
jgi:hypothetical protein